MEREITLNEWAERHPEVAADVEQIDAEPEQEREEPPVARVVIDIRSDSQLDVYRPPPWQPSNPVWPRLAKEVVIAVIATLIVAGAAAAL